MNNHFIKKLLIASFFSSASIFAQELITSVTVEHNKAVFTINPRFKKQYLKSDFFIQYSEDIDLSKIDYSIVTMPCILNLLSLVWISGQEYTIKSMDEDLYHSIKRLKQLFKIIYPKTAWTGKLVPHTLVKNQSPVAPRKHECALIFSGGLDSTVTSLIHRDQKQLLITAWGQWDLPLKDVKVWKRVKDRIVSFAQTHGHQTTFIRSNYFEFLNREVLNFLSPEITNWRIQTIENIGWAGMTAPLLYLKGYRSLLIASGNTWDTLYPTGTFPFIDRNIVCAGISFEHEQFDLMRVDKIEYLVNLCKKEGVKKPFLTVCPRQTGNNCCYCRKCLTTALTLFMLGDNPQEYGFNISKEQALVRAKTLLASIFRNEPLNVADVDHLYELRKKASQLTKRGIPFDTRIAALINFDFKQKLVKTIEYKHQTPIDWNKLHEAFPHIEVPQQYLTKKR